uniref:Uncharacterized protein n=1 Tax=Glossina brevipalpis TaxID=37001 RepID=A0A1A9W382_9MUSC
MKIKKMLYKKDALKFVLLLSITQSLLMTFTTATYCSLDRMKMFAMEACEHLLEFEDLQARETRSVFHGLKKNERNGNFVSARYRGDNRNYIRRSIYPQGGYLKVSFEHFQKLSRLDVFPKYKAKQNSHHEIKRRHKRDDNNYNIGNNDNKNNNSNNNNNNITYCCYHTCDEEFFC